MSIMDPASATADVTPHDTNKIVPLPARLYVGTGGTVVLRCKDDTSDRTYLNVASGSYLYVRAEMVKTATSASGIVAEYA
jgi:hypothetical protein